MRIQWPCTSNRSLASPNDCVPRFFDLNLREADCCALVLAILAIVVVGERFSQVGERALTDAFGHLEYPRKLRMFDGVELSF